LIQKEGRAKGIAQWLQRAPKNALVLSALAGALAALGQAPFDLWYLSLPAFAALLALFCKADTPRQAAMRAWVGGAAYFAVSLHWIVEPFFVDAARHGWMAPFALTALSFGLALFWALPAWGAARVYPAKSTSLRLLAMACLLALGEYARATVLTGFPWAHPGHVLIDTGALRLAAVLGPHGLNAYIIGAAAGVAWLARRQGGKLWAAGLVAVFTLIGLIPYSTSQYLNPDAPNLRLVQPNAPQHLKWRTDMIPVFFDRALQLTAGADNSADPDLVIWPETALAVLLNQSEQARVQIAQASGPAPVILGGQRLGEGGGFNTLAVLDAQGEIQDFYDKHHLVPFGEYIPLQPLARRLGLRGLADRMGGGYTAGSGPSLLDLGALGRVFPMICYEAIFPNYIRQSERPDWMLHITNDAWFGTFSGPYQHLALARLRAAEQGLPLLRAANTGISGVIDARGQVLASLALGEAGYLDVSLPPALPPTLYARFSDWPILAIVFATLGLCVALRRKKRH